MSGFHPGGPGGGTTLVDLLDRVLDKGLVVAGDIKISLANVELLTIKIRLIVCSIDKAEQIGLNWWRYDQSLAQPEPLAPLPDPATVALLEARIAQLETQLAQEALNRSARQSTRARSRPRSEGGGA